MTWHYWALVCGVIAPLLPLLISSYVVGRRIAEEGDLPGLALYGVVLGLGMGLPPLLLVGLILSWVLRRPHTASRRFLLGFAVGVVLIAISQVDIKF